MDLLNIAVAGLGPERSQRSHCFLVDERFREVKSKTIQTRGSAYS